MKKTLLFITILIVTSHISFAQNRGIARGAEPGELYLTDLWYGIYGPVGPPFYDTVRAAIYRITENGKKLTIQYDADYFAEYYTPPGSVMMPGVILADATPGALYTRNTYSKNNYTHTSLWVSFDYGENWIFREENIGSKTYRSVNLEGFLYRGGTDGILKSENFGNTFTNFDVAGVGMEAGLQYGEGWRVWVTNPYQGRIFHSYDFFETYIEIPIDSQFVFGQASGGSPDIFRGGLPGEVYITSWFPGYIYKVSFSADTGHTFRHVYITDYDVNNPSIYKPLFMSDREPSVFYIIRRYRVEDDNPWGFHIKICIDYYRDYGETLEATFCHDITKNYEYEEVICNYTTHLESNAGQNSVQLQWSNSANNEFIRGYHVYRDNMRITSQLLTNSTYLDEDLLTGDYEYYVKTYYMEGCISDRSNYVIETITVGVNEVNALERIEIYPNPTTGELKIQNLTFKVTDLQIFDVYGRNILTSPMPLLSHEISLNISHLQPGIYFVRITTEKGVVTKKVVKQ